MDRVTFVYPFVLLVMMLAYRTEPSSKTRLYISIGLGCVIVLAFIFDFARALRKGKLHGQRTAELG